MILVALPAAAHAARAWRAPIELSASGDDAWVGKLVPSLDVMPDGRAVVAWREGDGPGPVKVAEKPLAGPLAGPSTLGFGRNPPSVATTLDGRAFVAWVGSDAAGGWEEDTVFVSERGDDGTYGPAKALGTEAQSYLQPGTAVAANELGDAVVLFTTGTWNDQQLWSARRTRDGVWQKPKALAGPIGEAVWRLHAGMSETGEATFAWLSWDPTRENSAWTAIEPADGPAADVRRMHASGNRSSMPSLAVDKLGNAVVSWIELPPDDTVFVGEVRVAVRAPGQPFGKSIDTGGTATDFSEPQVGLSDDGYALVAWQGATRNGPNGASLGGLLATVGVVPTGVFAPTEQVTYELVDDPLTTAVDPFGNALFFFGDWNTGEQRVVRRSAAGLYGQTRAVVPCPRVRTYPVAAGVDPLGNASYLWAESFFGKGWQGIRLSQDQASTSFSPDPCPPEPPPLIWTPKDPAPGQNVTLDASGSQEPDAASTTFKWDLDNDGTFETDTGETPTTSRAFGDAGEHKIGLQVRVESHDTGNSGTWSGYYTIRVGSPPDPPNEYPRMPADPRPSDLPDEDPWPIGDARLPTLPPVLELPLHGGLDLLQSSTQLANPAGPIAPPADPADLVLEAPPQLRPSALLSKGLPVRLTSKRNGEVRLRLLDSAGKVVGGPATIKVRKRRAALVRLQLTRTASKRVRAGKLRRLTVEAAPRSGPKLRQKVRVR